MATDRPKGSHILEHAKFIILLTSTIQPVTFKRRTDMAEAYKFEGTKMSLDDLCLKLVNEHSFYDIFQKLRTYVVDYHSGYESWKGERFAILKDSQTATLDNMLAIVISMIQTFEKENL